MRRYITTTLPYVNADQHIGFALELVQADVLARAGRLSGDEVFFNTGTDEHGQKIFEAANKAGVDVASYVGAAAEKVKDLEQLLAISNDAFIRTTNPAHIKAVQEMWKRCEESGDIYKKAYTGLYCVGCEAFKTARELTADKHCLIHPNLTLETITEENYFFKFSNYEKQLLDYLERPEVIVPAWRKEEAIAFVKGGLEDFSISREKKNGNEWGIPVPGDDSQVMYVWFDALTNYISTLGWPEDREGKFKAFWEEGQTIQVAGKDQVRFQSLMWQAMLMSAGIKNTDQVFYHGFINSGGQRMSKSLGNVIAPGELVEKYGVDATRYLLLRHVHPFEDSDVTWERLDEWYTANLTNGLGNLVARIMKLAEDNLDESGKLLDPPHDLWKRIDKFEFQDYLDGIWIKIGQLDGMITVDRPFELVKKDPEQGKLKLKIMVNELYEIARFLEPAMPSTSAKIIEAIKSNKKPENLFPRIEK